MLASSKIVFKNSIHYVFYGPSMRHFANKLLLRNMATVTSQNHLHHQDISMANSSSNWPNDPDFPLPGNVGVDTTVVGGDIGQTVKKPPPYRSLASALLELGSESLNKKFVLSDFIKESKEATDEASLSNDNSENITETVDDEGSFTVSTIVDSMHSNSKVEFKIQECPVKLVKRFNELFLNTLKSAALTVISITQHTENDMSTWSDEVEDERNMFTDVFVESAKKICVKIKTSGYWADFIDPMSGLAFYSGNPNKTLSETDDCFNQLGFHVEDLGCCKVLQHKQWKNNAFVGLIFTSAPVESHVFELL